MSGDRENILARRRMIVVRQRQGYSLCVPVYTYNEEILAKKPVSQEELQAHGIVYPRGDKVPKSRPGEPPISKKPIAVDVVAGHDLDPSDRISFGKCHTVDHDVLVMDCGHVAAASMADFEAYWKEELLR